MTKQSIILQKLNANVPKPLFHYTDIEGLCGILDSKNIWTTKIQYLSDKTEMDLALEYINEEIDNQLNGKDKTRNDQELFEMKEMIEALANQKTNVSVASFTSQGDQLSQWRGYCEIGTGYSLGFDSQRLLGKLIENKNPYYLVECEYNEENHRLMAKELVNSSVPVVNILQHPNYGKPPFNNWTFVQSVLFLAPMIKSEKFKEEQEWRLISSPLTLNYENAKFRSGNYSLIPYWEFHIDIIDALTSIVVGPTPEPELSKQALQGLLSQKGINFTYVENSKIPYGQI